MEPATNHAGALVGRIAPHFEIACTPSPRHPKPVAHLQDYRDRWLVLMFYPQDFSLVCPTELRGMSDRYDEIIKRGADVLAISTDSVESHHDWIHKLPSEGGLGPVQFPLGSDPTGAVARRYHVFAEAQGVAMRGLFLIDPNSVIQMQMVHNLSVGRRTEDVLRVLKAMQVGGLCAENWSPGDDRIDPIAELKPGHIIAHYRIEEKIGQGGFAAVYRAHDRTLRRRVALKVLKPQGQRARSALAEARAAASLNHPNICTVYNVDDAEGVSMIVMEFLVGRTLKEVIAEGCPAEKVPGIVSQIAAGMAAAHAFSVVHGDLKPSNIMLTEGGTVKILDFGLAGQTRIPPTSESTLSLGVSESDVLGGTPSYMSPEQTEGQKPTPASDVFALGLVVYELLTGRRAFEEQPVLRLLHEIRSINPSALAGQVPQAYRALLQGMLAAEPACRTVTMQELQNGLPA